MADMYVRKLRPNKMHILAAVFLLLSLILFANGIHRLGRVSSRLDQAGFIFEDDDVRENRGVLFSAVPYKGRLKGAEKSRDVVAANVQKGIMKNIEIFIGSVHRKYQFIAVEKDSEEYRKLLAGEKVTGYFSYEYTDKLLDFVSRMGNYYAEEDVIPVENVTKLGVVVVNREKEQRSVFYGLPFLIIGILLMIKAGSPFFSFPVEKT